MYICGACKFGFHHNHNKLGCVVKGPLEESCRCTVGARVPSKKEDIYADLYGCEDEPEKGLRGSWQKPTTVGVCNACYSGDNLSGYDAQVFEFKMHGLIARLCRGHLRELVKQSRIR